MFCSATLHLRFTVQMLLKFRPDIILKIVCNTRVRENLETLYSQELWQIKLSYTNKAIIA